MRKYYISMKDIKRYKVIQEWEEGKVKGREVCMVLGISYRQALRIRKRFREEGFEGLLRRFGSGRKSISKDTREEVKRLYTEVYGGRFNILHFKEKLEEIHDIKLSYGSVRNILMEGGLHRVRKRRRKFHKRRARMPKSGMLIQMDTSFHQWVEAIPEKWCLISMIDDATNEVVYARFFPRDTAFNNMEGIRSTIEKKGLFMSLYVDKASHFTTTRYGGLHYDVREEQKGTNIESALDELGITLITANSPQAKGRIERLFGFFQDRLINEIWLRGIKDYREANRFLKKEFIPWYNKRYNHKTTGNVYTPINGINLDLIFTKRYLRRVAKDNTISILGETIQLGPTGKKLNFVRAEVEVRMSPKNKIWILYKGNVILKTKLSKNNKILKKEKRIEEILKNRTPA